MDQHVLGMAWEIPVDKLTDSVLRHGQTVVQANLANSWYRLLRDSLVWTLSPLAMRAH